MSTSSAEFGIAISGGFVQPARGGRLHGQLMAGVGMLFDWLANPWVLLFCKLVIGFVSAYDIFLTIKYYETLPSMELNPIGRWMMMLDNGPECELNQIAAFITAKFAGNFVVLCVIELLVKWKHRMAAIVALAVASCQVMLFVFLQFSDWFKSAPL